MNHFVLSCPEQRHFGPIWRILCFVVRRTWKTQMAICSGRSTGISLTIMYSRACAQFSSNAFSFNLFSSNPIRLGRNGLDENRLDQNELDEK